MVRRRLARLITEMLAPAPVAGSLLLVVALHSTRTAAGLWWGLLAAFFAVLLPFLYLLRGVRRRQFTDHHVSVRWQRPLPLSVGVASVLVGLGLMVMLRAPLELVALVVAMAVGPAVSLLVTLVWEISIHVAVAAGAIVILVLVFGPQFLAAAPLVALVGWARVEVGDHTPMQVVAGAVLGATVAAVVFTLLR